MQRKVREKSYNAKGYGEDKKNEFKALLNSAEFDLDISYSAKEMLSKIKIDKKAESGAVSLILIKDIANIEIVKISLEKLMELM